MKREARKTNRVYGVFEPRITTRQKAGGSTGRVYVPLAVRRARPELPRWGISVAQAAALGATGFTRCTTQRQIVAQWPQSYWAGHEDKKELV